MTEIYNFFEKTTKEYLGLKSKDYRKIYSQFFTPIEIAKLMLEDLEIPKDKDTIHILEPSAGTGILILSAIEKIIFNNKNIKKIFVTAIEIDNELYKILNKNLDFLKKKIKNIEIEIEVKNSNFIEEYGKYWNETINLFSSNSKIQYDLIVSNPPYKKTTKYSKENIFFKGLIIGQPNLYHLFIALSLKVLADDGNYILISPKNYLGGKYTENLRNFIFDNYSLKRLHLFNERNKIFGNEVLQEICISHFVKKKIDNIKLTYNGNKDNPFYVKLEEILLDNSNALIFPKSKRELYYKNKFIDNFVLLKDQNLEFRVGEVVQFRIEEKDKLSTEFSKNQVPLLIAHHIDRNKIHYSKIVVGKKNKNISLFFNERTRKKIIKNQNYVILRKNVDFESKDFIKAVVYNKKVFDTDFIGVDNNLAYIKAINGELSLEKAEKICKFLNSRLFEIYYKMLNNSHTINSYEFSRMLFPKF